MSRRRKVVIAVPVAVVVLVAGVALTLRMKATKPTSFTRGGPFQRAEVPDPVASPTPSVPAEAIVTPSPTPSPQASRAAPPPAASPSPAKDPPNGAGKAGQPEAAPPAPPPAAALATIGVPAEGIYRYRLEGSESIAGLSRPFPSTATVSVHDRRQTAAGTELTFDVTYIPGGHEGRIISTFGPRGMETTFEGGSIVFLGLLSQTSQSNYSPAIVRTPYPSQAAWSGSSDAHDASSGSGGSSGAVTRTERYEGSFAGAEAVEIGGQKVDTFVYDLSSTFSGAESGMRQMRYWLDPGRGLWVKWTEKIHGVRGPLIYDEQATMTLQDGPQ